MRLLPNWLKSNESLNGSFEAQQFLVSYKDLSVGILSYDGNKYKFEYTEAFKNQDEIGAIDNFLDTNRVYESKYLFPFFLARIPSTIGFPLLESFPSVSIKPLGLKI